MYYRNAIDLSLLTNKLNLKCYVLYETKELLTITKIYITAIINILTFMVSIVIVIIIIVTIISIIITINLVTISTITVFGKSAWQIC